MTENQQAQPDVMQRFPPLILHPFSGDGGASQLLEGSRAAIALQEKTFEPDSVAELENKVLRGRYHEVRMLLFLGKDLFRWMSQCLDQVNRSGYTGRNYCLQSFAELVVDAPPAKVTRKLEAWGVSDRRAIFSRAIGIHSVFEQPPPADTLTADFLYHYHRYADHAYSCFLHLNAYRTLTPSECDFEIFASEEYSRMLEKQWETQSGG